MRPVQGRADRCKRFDMPHSGARDVLTPEALEMLQAIAAAGSFAAAARAVGLAPSALTYRVRRIEDALDVLLFDRSSRQARLTEAGAELVREAARLLQEVDSVANRVRRVATGWEPQFTLAVDSALNFTTVFELCEDFYAQQPPTRLRIRTEVLSGPVDALVSGLADLAIGVVTEAATVAGLQTRPLGTVRFAFVVAPHHPLASAPEPLDDALIARHRIVAVADSAQRGAGISMGLLEGQDVLTVTTLHAKLEAQLRGLGCGFLPEDLVAPYVETGRLVARRVARRERQLHASYAWRAAPHGAPGRALRWWLDRLEQPRTREALMRALPRREDDAPPR